MEEKWKPHPQYRTLEVSTHGRARIIETGKILKANKKYNGTYYSFKHPSRTTRIQKLGHVLVADTFLEPDITRKYIAFKDGDIFNCRLDNIERVTSTTDVRNSKKKS